MYFLGRITIICDIARAVLIWWDLLTLRNLSFLPTYLFVIYLFAPLDSDLQCKTIIDKNIRNPYVDYHSTPYTYIILRPITHSIKTISGDSHILLSTPFNYKPICYKFIAKYNSNFLLHNLRDLTRPENQQKRPSARYRRGKIMLITIAMEWRCI